MKKKMSAIPLSSLSAFLFLITFSSFFQLHRTIMGLAVLLTVISIIIIFVDKEGWSEVS